MAIAFGLLFPIVFWFVARPGGSFAGLLLLSILISFIAFPPGGYLWGAWMWTWAEKQYLAARDKARVDHELERLANEVDQLRERLPTANDTNITGENA